MNLREDWNKAHKFISVQALSLLAAIQGVWPTIPDDLKASLPHSFLQWLTYGLMIVAVYGIMTKQGNLKNESPDAGSH